MNFTARKYQKNIINKQKDYSSFIIAKMGAGKTSATLYTISEGLANREFSNVLIIAPKIVALNVWSSEINKWDDFKHLDYSICVGTKPQRIKAINNNSSITVINHDNLDWLFKHLNDNRLDFYDFLVVDESSCFKSSKTRRFKSLKHFNKKAKKRTLLTGTPIPNSYLDIWSQIFILDNGKRLLKNMTAFKSEYFHADYMGYSFELKSTSKKIIDDKISDLCVVVENYKSLTNKIDIINKVTLPTNKLKVYNKMKREFLINLKDEDITACNSAVLVNKLQQLSNGAIYNEEKDVIMLHDEKLQMLTELIDQVSDENVIVAYNFKHDYSRIKSAFKHAVDVKDKNAVDNWNNGKIKLLLIHPKSASHGLNLQNGGNRIIWFSPTYSSESKLQLDSRLHRQGQTKTVFVHTIVCENTVDIDILKVLDNKINVQNVLINYLKHLTHTI